MVTKHSYFFKFLRLLYNLLPPRPFSFFFFLSSSNLSIYQFFFWEKKAEIFLCCLQKLNRSHIHFYSYHNSFAFWFPSNQKHFQGISGKVYLSTSESTKQNFAKKFQFKGSDKSRLFSKRKSAKSLGGWELKLPSLPGGIFHCKTRRVNRSGKDTCSLAGAGYIHNSSQSKLLARTGKTFLYSLHPVTYKNAPQETSLSV